MLGWLIVVFPNFSSLSSYKFQLAFGKYTDKYHEYRNNGCITGSRRSDDNENDISGIESQSILLGCSYCWTVQQRTMHCCTTIEHKNKSLILAEKSNMRCQPTATQMNSPDRQHSIQNWQLICIATANQPTINDPSVLPTHSTQPTNSQVIRHTACLITNLL